MLLSLRAAWLPLTIVFIAGTAAAQTGRPAPHDAQAPIPALNYSSPFTGYRAFVEQEVSPWRDSNDTVGRIGGWRAYAREASQPAPKPQPDARADEHSQHHRSAP
jgi:hypothetical protein